MASLRHTSARPTAADATFAAHQMFFESLAPSTALTHTRSSKNSRMATLYSSAISKTLRLNITRAWKRATSATRKHERASVLPDGFVLLPGKVA